MAWGGPRVGFEAERDLEQGVERELQRAARRSRGAPARRAAPRERRRVTTGPRRCRARRPRSARERAGASGIFRLKRTSTPERPRVYVVSPQRVEIKQHRAT